MRARLPGLHSCGPHAPWRQPTNPACHPSFHLPACSAIPWIPKWWRPCQPWNEGQAAWCAQLWPLCSMMAAHKPCLPSLLPPPPHPTPTSMLTLSLDPRMVEAVSTMNMRARLPGLHSSFSSWPMMTARASTRICVSMPCSLLDFSPLIANGPVVGGVFFFIYRLFLNLFYLCSDRWGWGW